MRIFKGCLEVKGTEEVKRKRKEQQLKILGRGEGWRMAMCKVKKLPSKTQVE